VPQMPCRHCCDELTARCCRRRLILTLVVNDVCVSYVRYAGCNDGLYRRNRRQMVNAVSNHTAGHEIISMHYVYTHGQVVTYLKVL